MINTNILASIIINVFIASSEVFVGLFIGSLTLVSDAVHNFSDVGTLGLSWWGEKIKEKGNTNLKTYGYKRVEILIAFFNSLVLLAIVVFIFLKAVQRLLNPSEITSGAFIAAALIAMVGNGVAAYFLKKEAHKSLNMESAWLHSLQDALVSLGGVVGGILIYFFHWYIIDPIISIALSIFILKEVYELMKKTLDILMESVPSDIDFEKVKLALENYSGVSMANDIHIWQTDSNSRFLSAHLEIENVENGERNRLLSKIKTMLLQDFNINHATLQMVSVGSGEEVDFKNNHCN